MVKDIKVETIVSKLNWKYQLEISVLRYTFLQGISSKMAQEQCHFSRNKHLYPHNLLL